MEIKIKNYTLVSAEHRFDLYEDRLVVAIDFKTKKKTGKKEMRHLIVGYAMTLETCLNHIIARNLHDQDLTVDLSTYLEMLQKERLEITKLANV